MKIIASLKYHDNQPVKPGDLIATSRLGTCRIISTIGDTAEAVNTVTRERFDLCSIALSDSDLIERRERLYAMVANDFMDTSGKRFCCVALCERAKGMHACINSEDGEISVRAVPWLSCRGAAMKRIHRKYAARSIPLQFI